MRSPRAALVVGLLLAAASAEARGLPGLPGRKGPRPGQPMTIQGRVNDGAGAPLEGVSVLFEATRKTFRLRKLGREKGPTLRIPVTVEAGGSYHVDWRFDSYYNLFELTVALGVRKAGEDTFEIFHRVDISDMLRSGSAGPFEVSLTVADTSRLEELRGFLQSLGSDDELRVYQEMGLPDRVDVGQADYDPDRSWWYFAAGKVYRFRDGELEGVVPFDPVGP